VKFKAFSIAGSTKVNIGFADFPGTIAHEVHGNLGRELVRLANLQLDRECGVEVWPDPSDYELYERKRKKKR